MKAKLFLLSTLLTICGQAMAQKVLLPYGQESNEAWEAKYFYAPNDGEKPDENWYKTDFDDSNWGNIQGPLSLTPTGIWNKWESTYATYWLRRTFVFNNVSLYPTIRLKEVHDDIIEVYLNGTLIYSSSQACSATITFELNQDMRNLLVEGKNVVAVKVSDTRGGFSNVDFGLYAYDTPDLTNNDFNSALTGWQCTGEGITQGGQSFNYLARSLSQNPFDVHQTISNASKGLYRVRAQAFEGCVDINVYPAWKDYKENKPTVTYLYAGETRHPIKNIFDEAVASNIYLSNEYYKTPESTYVPQYMTSTSIFYVTINSF